MEGGRMDGLKTVLWITYSFNCCFVYLVLIDLKFLHLNPLCSRDMFQPFPSQSQPLKPSRTNKCICSTNNKLQGSFLMWSPLVRRHLSEHFLWSNCMQKAVTFAHLRRQFRLNCVKIITLKIAQKIVALFTENYPSPRLDTVAGVSC